MAEPPEIQTRVKSVTKNRYNKTEWAGAFGDMGTLIPFVVGYITMLKMDPLGILYIISYGRVFCLEYRNWFSSRNFYARMPKKEDY